MDAGTRIQRSAGFREALKTFPDNLFSDEIWENYELGKPGNAIHIFKKLTPNVIVVEDFFIACGVINVMRCHGLKILGICASATPVGILLIKEASMSACAAFHALHVAGLD